MSRGIYNIRNEAGELVPVWYMRRSGSNRYMTGACPQCGGAVKEEEEWDSTSYDEIVGDEEYNSPCKCQIS